jgi:uncharacterized protein HemX
MPDTQQKVSFAAGGLPIPLLQMLLSVVVVAVVGYGAGKFASGQSDAQIQELQRLAVSNKAEIDYLRNNSVSQEQMKLLIQMVQGIREDQTEIKRELSAIRRER